MPSDSDDSVSERGKVLTEEELDLTRHDNVSELDDGRYVVSTGSGPTSDEATEARENVRDALDDDPGDSAADDEPEITEMDVNAWLEDYFREADAQYGFHATAKFDDGVSRHQVVSNDVVTSFESLLIWYAQHVGGGTPVEDVLGILLAESSVSVRYPVRTLTGLLKRYDLDRDDSIGDLLEAVADEEAVALSPD
ncbi:hypothetical protein DU500_10655 [Haloplanus rubicundus]|uniref:Flagella cluster protein n=1 Tax=Haloplanus rubicundus TaxID=1547898 RepID=A0A345EDF4_9EURY|nr:hypothetical protein [Haloplanus rubicundus]AXG06852.1 hypothetical protein DU500_10655 [Haloplanus rubicundus]AXG10226.1 hypothetical protein DU484_10410 [Haloplanus rubicundus]